jgi:hypothetical protein
LQNIVKRLSRIRDVSGVGGYAVQQAPRLD